MASQLACKSGTLCLLCLKIFDDPCALDCKHIFCTSCVTGAIRESKLRAPFACPICHQTSISSQDVSENMKRGADEFKQKADIVEKEQTNPELLALKCKNRSCQEKATHNCSHCGYFCPRHLDSHNDVFDDHIEFLSQVEHGARLNAANLKCPIHTFEIEYYCAECPSKPFKCAKCLADDHKTAYSECKPHKYIQYRGSDSLQFKDLLQKEIDLLMFRAKTAQELKNKIDEERTKISQNFASFRREANQFLDVLQKSVDQLKAGIFKQLDNMEEECNCELQRKFNELQADDERLKLSQQLMKDIIENFGNMKPAEVHNILKHSKETLSIPVRELLLNPMKIRDRLPRELLQQLERLNRQMLVGLEMKTPAEQLLSPDSISSKDQLQNFIFDQSSQKYFGIRKQTQEILNFDKEMKIVQKSTPHLCIKTDFHDLQGISLSKHGVLAVADSLANTITLFDKGSMSIGMVIRSYGENEEKLFHAPCDVAFDSQDRMFVVDSGSKIVIVFDENFKFSQIIKITKSEVGLPEYAPRMIEIGAQDGLYVYCSGSESIVVFDNDFNFVEVKRIR